MPKPDASKGEGDVTVWDAIVPLIRARVSTEEGGEEAAAQVLVTRPAEGTHGESSHDADAAVATTTWRFFHRRAPGFPLTPVRNDAPLSSLWLTPGSDTIEIYAVDYTKTPLGKAGRITMGGMDTLFSAQPITSLWKCFDLLTSVNAVAFARGQIVVCIDMNSNGWFNLSRTGTTHTVWSSSHETIDIDVTVATMKEYSGSGDSSLSTLLANQASGEIGEYTVDITSDEIRLTNKGDKRTIVLGRTFVQF